MAKNDSTKATEQKYDFNAYRHTDFKNIKATLPKQHFLSVVERTLSVVGGIAVIVKMLEANNLDKECDGNHLMNANDEWMLSRLAGSAADMLYEDVSSSLECVVKFCSETEE